MNKCSIKIADDLAQNLGLKLGFSRFQATALPIVLQTLLGQLVDTCKILLT